MKASSYTKKARKIREAGLKAEREFFGKGGPLEVKGNPKIGEILYQVGNYTVRKAKKGYEVYEDKSTHAVRKDIIGTDGADWFARAKEVADRRFKENPITVVGLANPGRKTYLVKGNPVIDPQEWAIKIQRFPRRSAIELFASRPKNYVRTTEYIGYFLSNLITARKTVLPRGQAYWNITRSIYEKLPEYGKHVARYFSTEQEIYKGEAEGSMIPAEFEKNPITVVGLANPGRKTYLVYGLPRGETERWKEDILSSHSHTQADIRAVKDAAGRDGWHSFRVVLLDDGPPDFTKVLSNPLRSVSANIEGIIYNRCIEIRAEKTGYKAGFYKHPFSKGSKVCIYGLDNGDLLVHSKAGVKLWQPD